jgi:hypothetical protein
MYFQQSLPDKENDKPPHIREPFYDRQYCLADRFAHKSHRANYERFIVGDWRFTGWKRKGPDDEIKEDFARKAFAADFAASVVTGLVASGYTDHAFFYREAIGGLPQRNPEFRV